MMGWLRSAQGHSPHHVQIDVEETMRKDNKATKSVNLWLEAVPVLFFRVSSSTTPLIWKGRRSQQHHFWGV